MTVPVHHLNTNNAMKNHAHAGIIVAGIIITGNDVNHTNVCTTITLMISDHLIRIPIPAQLDSGKNY